MLLWRIVWILLGLSALSAVLGDRVSEQTAFQLLQLGIFVGVVLLLGWSYWLKRSNSLSSLCRDFRHDRPHDYDRLEAALELEANSANADAFQQEYLSELQERYLKEECRALKHAQSWYPQWRPLTLVLALFCAGGLVFLGQGAWERFWNRTIGVEAVAIERLPEKIPVHQDMAISARIQRYGVEGGVFLESVQGGVHRKEAMICGADEAWHLTLFDLTEETYYRVVTKNAASRWRKFIVYVPPAPKSVTITTRPPEYTGLEARTFQEFQDLELVEGEMLSMDCEMPIEQRWELVDGESFYAPPVEFFPRNQAVYLPRFFMEDVSADGTAFRTTVRPDQAPLIELVAPQEDEKITPNTRPALVAMTSDDYGVSQVALHFVIDEGEEVTKELWRDAPQKNVDINQAIDLGTLEGGQVVSGWLEALDNRQPKGHASRSSMFFLTVIPATEDMPPADGQNQQGDQKSQEMSVDDLITESKRLLRGTQDAEARREYVSEELALREQHELSRDLRSLAVAVSGRQVVVAKNAGVAELPPDLAQFFVNATRALEEAGGLVEAGQLLPSRKPQQRALTQLTRLAWMLLQNAQQMAQKGQSGQQSEQSGDQKQSQDQSQSQKGDRNFDMQKLQQALDDIQQLRREEQQVLSELSPKDAAVERRLASRSNDIGSAVASVASAAAAVPPIREAARELVGAAEQLEHGDVNNARLRGDRAVQALTTAESLLQEALRKESLEQMDRLAQKADELAQEQRQQARNSEKMGQGIPSAEEKKAARDAQSALQEKSQRFREEAASSLQNLSRQFPQAADALSEALRSSAADDVQKAQQKAQNALLYGRFERATESQDRAADALEHWRDQLAHAGEQIPQYTPEELQQALEELQERAGELAQAKSQQAQNDAQRNAAQSLKGLGEKFHTGELSQLGEAAMKGTPQEALAALEAARAFLREELAKMMGEDALRYTHSAVPLPKKYRPQVQEYFRRLGE